MSLYESDERNGTVSLMDLKNGKFNFSKSQTTIEDYAFAVCRGGWPVSIGLKKDIALQQAKDYYNVVVTDDIFSLKSVKIVKDEEKATGNNAFLMVVTKGNIAYKRDDGVYVVSLGCLKD